MNLPNFLTGIRFLMIPIFGYYLYVRNYKVASILFIFAGLTDVLDGFIARKYNLITSWGKLADPLADKLIQLTALIFLTINNLIPSIFLIIVLVKESMMIIGSALLYKKDNVVVYANWYGKLATVVFYLAIFMTIIFNALNINTLYINILITIAVLLTLYAFIMYVIQYRKIKLQSHDDVK